MGIASSFKRSRSLFLLPVLASVAAIPALVAGCNPSISDDGPIVCPSAEGPFGGDACCEGDCRPQDQPVTISPVRPKPLSGGTLHISTKTGETAVVSDPDRDRVQLVDLPSGSVTTIATAADAEPGRAINDATGTFHVVLRGAASLLNVDPQNASAWTTTSTCADPRGIAYDSAANRILVACASGTIQSFSASANPSLVSSVQLSDGDLRDIVLSNGKVFVSHFRSTTIDLLDATTLKVVKSRRPAGYVGSFDDATSINSTYEPSVGWRMAARPGGGVLLAHQQARSSSVVIPEDGGNTYGGFDCNTGILHSDVTGFGDDGEATNAEGAGGLAGVTLPVDIAVAHTGGRIAVVGAGSSLIVETTIETISKHDGCLDNFPVNGSFADANGFMPDGRVIPGSQEPVAVDYDADDNLVVQLREPASLEIHGSLSGDVVQQIDLGGDSRVDTGYTMFHGNPDQLGAAITCASCHPEGREDGHTWNFANQGARRTQSLAGDIRGTAPFHWQGDLADIGAVMNEVFVKRMGGQPQSDARVDAIGSYIGTFPSAPAVAQASADAIERGRVLFASADTGCASCHIGAKLTNNTSVNVGTGGVFQVPSLQGVGARTPLMHDGCAATLRDRFNPSCGGGDAHGTTSQLSEAQIGDLVAYLESL